VHVAVTGAHGFVGVNVVRTLAAQGETVIAIGRRQPDSWVTAFLDGAGDVTHVRADLAVPGELAASLDGVRLDAVVHAAVVTATTLAVERNEAARIVHVNASGTIEALEAARAAGATRFVYISSPSAIGTPPPGVRLDESVRKNPDTLYGITKDFSEEAVRRYGTLHDLEVASIRIAQPYGPGERATSSRIRTSPIYEWLRDAEAGRELPAGPLERARDWTYIDDTARGISMVATRREPPAHDLYHLAYQRQVTVREVIECLRAAYPGLRYTEAPEPDEINPNIAGSGAREPLDAGRFRDEYGWLPTTGIEEGMRRYLAWWRDFPFRQ
jgi:nucleoside-diphosphate-sugar epimerase